MFEINGKYTTAKVMIDDVEESCVGQITQFVNHPAFSRPVSIMPDTHAGKGSVIGFTMELSDKVIPNVVGVDIGCGMLSINFGKNFPITLSELDQKIRQKVPFGQDVHETSVINFEKEFPWKKLNLLKDSFVNAYRNKYERHCSAIPDYNMNWFTSKCDTIGANVRRMISSIGTLGGGNHFIETGISTNGDYWITIHSGSRNFGKRICEYWQNIAEKHFAKEFTGKKQQEIDDAKTQYQGDERYKKIQEIKAKYKIGIDANGLEWLEGNEYFGYLFDMLFSQMYASINRMYMSSIIQSIVKIDPLESIETIHNFIDFHDFVIRKGAIRSYKDEKMIIPFNMKDGILICEGQSNTEWNCSAPHGAGRVMSRSQAKKAIDLSDFQKQMEGIYSTSVGRGTLDEAPGAYKDASVIENAIAPTAIIIDKIKPIHNMKDGLGESADG